MTPSETFDMTDRVAMVSGAGRGMGRAMALAFAGAGADVVVVDRDAESNRQTASMIRLATKSSLYIGNCTVTCGNEAKLARSSGMFFRYL